MIKYTIKRLLLMIPILLGVIIVVFTINYFSTGSPAMAQLGSAATPENIAELEHEMGLDRPYFVQLGDYIWKIVSHFDLGGSYAYKRPVIEMIGEVVGRTVALGLLGTVLCIIIGVPLGVLAATKQYSFIDYASTVFATILAALPSFWLALMLMLLFAVKLNWLPISGLDGPLNYVLPVIAIGAFPVANVTRMTRSSMLEVIRQDYITTAKAKGLPSGRVIFVHALRNGMIPVVTMIGVSAGLAMTGTIIIETIFNIPGMGLLMNTAINYYDYNLTQGVVLICAIIICGTNLITDLLYAFIDPRIRERYSSTSRRKIRIQKRKMVNMAEHPEKGGEVSG